jgi:hypothetical protein
LEGENYQFRFWLVKPKPESGSWFLRIETRIFEKRIKNYVISDNQRLTGN